MLVSKMRIYKPKILANFVFSYFLRNVEHIQESSFSSLVTMPSTKENTGVSGNVIKKNNFK